jgi:hypothetical protein
MPVRRVYLLHLTLLAPLLLARLTAGWPVLNALSWALLLGWTAAVWWASGEWVGVPLVRFGWAARLGPLAAAALRYLSERRPVSRAEERAGCLVMLAAMPAVGLALFAGVLAREAVEFLWEWWPLFVTSVLVADVLALTAALHSRSVLARLPGEREVAEAVRTLEEFYAANAADIGDRLSALRFRLELRRRVPERATPAQAWEAVAQMLVELQALAAEGARERGGREAALRRIDRQIEEARRQIDRHRSSPIPDASALEVARLEEDIRDLEAERRELLEAAAPAPTP